MRILVTGSRDWPDAFKVREAIAKAITDQPYGTHVVVVHGDCPTGADRFTREFLDELESERLDFVSQEAHPCDKECEIHGRAHMWKTLGKAAGPMCNQAMVLSGIDLCLAFPLGHEWSGTRDCMRRAVDAIGQDRVINCGDE